MPFPKPYTGPVVVRPARGCARAYETPTLAAKALGVSTGYLRAALRLGRTVKGHEVQFAYPDEVTYVDPGPFAGKSHSDETKARMSQAKADRKRSVTLILPNGSTRWFESAAAAARAMGWRPSDFRGKRLRGIRIERGLPMDGCFAGRKHTEETRTAMSERARARLAASDGHFPFKPLDGST